MKLIDTPHCKKHEVYQQNIGCRNTKVYRVPDKVQGNHNKWSLKEFQAGQMVLSLTMSHAPPQLPTWLRNAQTPRSGQSNPPNITELQALTESHTQLRSRRHTQKLTTGRRDYHRAIPMSIYEKTALCTIIYIVMLFIMAQIIGPKLQMNRNNYIAVVVAFAVPFIITICIGVLL
jgi:hypothetical protein